MRLRHVLGIILALMLGSALHAQTAILRVDPRAVNGTNDGLSWANAFIDLHTALAAASLNAGAVEIRIAGGEGVTYPLNSASSAFNIVRLGVASPLVVHGGYRGLGAGGSPDDRDVTAFPTALDGQDIARHVLTIDANPITTGYAVIVDGLTIRAGAASGLGDEGRGGGLFVKSTSDGLLSIAHCRFEDNFAINGGAIYWSGVASGAPSTLKPTIDRCAFIGNSASVAGGGANLSVAGLIVRDCEFNLNHALSPSTGVGGALRVGQDVTVLGCYFHDNSSMGAGGAVAIEFDRSLVKECLFQDNDAAASGGAVSISHNSDFESGVSVKVAGCFFLGNSASKGGALASFNPNSGGAGQTAVHTRIDNCAFFGNTADVEGGAIFDQKIVTVIISCVFSGNVAAVRGGAYAATRGNFSGESRKIVNSTFSGNSADLGGAIAYNSLGNSFNDVTNPKVRIQNTVFNQNTCTSSTTSDCGGTILHERLNPTTQSGPGQIRLDTTCIDGSAATGALETPTDSIYVGTAGNGFNGNLLETSPLLTRPFGFDGVAGTPDDDLTLRLISPCVDRGGNAALDAYADVADIDNNGNSMERPPLDAAYRPRHQDTVAPDWPGSSAPVVDLGAYEVPECQPCPGDSVWQFPLSGGFTDVVRWIGGVPDSARHTIFAGAGQYEVQFPASAVNRSVTVGAGDVHFDLNGHTWTLNASDVTPVVIGAAGADVASATFGAGRLLSGGGVIGRDAGSRGAVSLVEAGARWESSRSLSVGLSGFGELHVSAGASVFSLAGGVGEQPGAKGHVVLEGADADWTIFSTLTVSRGLLTMSDGATLTAGLAVSVFPDGEIAGDSLITSGLVQNFGVVRPGAPGAFAPSRLQIDGDYEQVGVLPLLGSESGVLSVAIGLDPLRQTIGATGLEVSGAAQLAGGLIAEFDEGFDPDATPVPALQILQAGTLIDRFDVALLPGLDGGRYFFIAYDYTNGTVTLGNTTLGAEVAVEDQHVTIATGQPSAVATGFINDDDFVDLILAVPSGDTSPGDVIVLLNDGVDGNGQWLDSFSQGVLIGVGVNPSDLAVADFDGDGMDDVAVALAGQHVVQVLLNDGAGSLELPGPEDTFAVGFEPRGVVAPDLNDDDRADIAVACFASDSVVMLINENIPLRGVALFADPIELSVGDGPRAITAVPNPEADIDGDDTNDDPRDLDGDGFVDLVTSNLFDDTITILSGPGALALRSGGDVRLGVVGVDIPAGEDPDTILPGDLDEDKDIDLVAAAANSDGSGVISVILNLGGLQFAPAVPLPIGTDVRSLTLIDFDHDNPDDPHGMGDLDIAAVVTDDAGDRIVRILRNDLTADGQLAFAPTDYQHSGDPLFVVAADVDDDFNADLVVINAPTVEQVVRGEPEFTLTVALNQFCPEDINGDGQIGFFEVNYITSAFNTETGEPGYQDAADLDGDGDVDFADLNVILGRFNSPCF